MVGTSNLGSWDGQWLWWVKLFFGWLSSPFGLVESPYSSHHNSLMGRAGSGHWPRRHRPYLVPCHSLAVDWFQAQVRMKGRWTGNHGELPFFLPSSMGNSLQIFRSKSLYVYFVFWHPASNPVLFFSRKRYAVQRVLHVSSSKPRAGCLFHLGG